MSPTKRYSDLEYDKAIEQICLRTESSLGKALARKLEPISDAAAIRKSLRLISEIQAALGDGMDLSLSDLTDISPLFSDSNSGIYDYDEFLILYLNLRLANSIHARRQYYIENTLLYKLISRLNSHPEPVASFERIFDPEGEVKDTASSELLRIRRSLGGLRNKIHRTMQSMLADPHLSNHLQDKFVTQREDRYVLPFKESSSGFVKGIVQAQSGSGSTLYIEPAAIVPLNNELQLLKQEEKREIHRIFSSLSEDFRLIKDELLRNQDALTELDFRYACGRFCYFLKAKVPTIVEEPSLSLVTARHPLLVIKQGSLHEVIPFSLELGEDYNFLVLSGPNTGGKTVLMKAVGLLTLLALSGIPIPVDESSSIGLFSRVFADIGDDQSIESALSTFSSHLEKISHMLSEGDERSLILIDEIGAATDPQQGSALAQAVLERLAEIACKGIVTTHYTALKVFAEESPACVNASMQFDTQALLPTYHFEIGFPGDSFAIEVAASRGMDTALINRAKELSGSQNIHFTELLKKLEEEKKALAREHYEYRLKNYNLQARISELESKEANLDKELKTRKQKFLQDLQKELISQQKIYQRELDELKQMERQDRKAHSERKLHDLNVRNNEINQTLSTASTSNRQLLRDASEGDRVWLPSFEAEATILEIRGKQALVDMNGISFKTPLDSLYRTQAKEEPAMQLSRTKLQAPITAKYELKLLGLTFDEAQPLIDEFLDEATLAGLHRLRIVHGKGTGALRSKVRSYLQGKPQVISLENPPMNEGGNGVTIVLI